MEVFLKAQYKNGLLYKAVQKCGTQGALAKYLGVSPVLLGRWLNFHDVPRFRNPIRGYEAKYDRWDQLLVTLIGYGLEEIFPIELQINKTEIAKAAKIEAVLDLPIEQLALIGVAPKMLPAPDDALLQREIAGEIKTQMETLTPREQKVLEMRFGLGKWNSEHTLEEVGEYFHVTRERVRQIEAKAMRKMRHPQRAAVLKPYAQQYLHAA